MKKAAVTVKSALTKHLGRVSKAALSLLGVPVRLGGSCVCGCVCFCFCLAIGGLRKGNECEVVLCSDGDKG